MFVRNETNLADTNESGLPSISVGPATDHRFAETRNLSLGAEKISMADERMFPRACRTSLATWLGGRLLQVDCAARNPPGLMQGQMKFV